MTARLFIRGAYTRHKREVSARITAAWWPRLPRSRFSANTARAHSVEEAFLSIDFFPLVGGNTA